MVRRLIVGVAIAAALGAAAAQPPADSMEDLANRARANASAYDASAEAAADAAFSREEVEALADHVKANAREIVGAELYDTLPAQIQQYEETYAADRELAQQRALDSMEAGVELARELAGGQIRALESTGRLPTDPDAAWKSPRYRLFISQSMPAAELKELVELARYDQSVVLVLRGMKPEQKLMEVQNMLLRLIGSVAEGESGPAITLDPEPFNELGVDQAPVLAEYDPSGKLLGFALGVTSKTWLSEQIGAGRRGNLGTYGPTVPVVEVDVIEVLKQKASEFDWQKSSEGALDRFWARTVAHDLPRVTGERVRMLDPTFEITESIIAPDGTVIARAGDRFNPLDAIPVKSTLVFFDPADADQVRWARETVGKHRGGRVTVMASQLRSIEKMTDLKALSRQIGAAVHMLPEEVLNTFHIQRVPTVVTVRDRQYHIHEQVP